jgi:hypothetical protein
MTRTPPLSTTRAGVQATALLLLVLVLVLLPVTRPLFTAAAVPPVLAVLAFMAAPAGSPGKVARAADGLGLAASVAALTG